MREIKFRAWDKKEKKWLLGYEMPNLGGFSLFGEIVMLGEWSQILDQYIFERNGHKQEDLVVMQFTGLKDKNGKEIYEGDVLRYNYRLNKPSSEDTDFFGEVVYDIRSIKCSELDAYHVGFILRGWDEVGGDYWYTDMPDMEDVEVIGNIYESPELLK